MWGVREWLGNIDWRREALYPLTAAMEVAWFTPWYLSLIPDTARLPALRTAIGLFVTMSVPVYGARLLDRFYLKPRLRQAALAALLALNCVLAMRLFLYAGQGYAGFDWLTETVRDVLDIHALIPDWFVILLSTLFLWWRGIHLAQRRPSVQAVVTGFYFGIAAFIGFVLIVNLVTDEDPSVFIPVFFFFSLMALGASRMETMRGLRGAIRSPFGFTWLFFIALASLVVICLGALLGALLTGSDARRALQWLQPLLLLVGVVLGLFLILLRTVVNWALGFLRALGVEQATEPLSDLLDGLSDLLPDGSEEGLQGPPALGGLLSLLRLLLILGTILGAGALVLRLIRRRDLPQPDGEKGEHESIFAQEDFVEDIRQWMGSSKDRLAAMLGLVGRSGLRGLFAAFTIRRIYAQMLDLAAAAGYPRAASQTPYEYVETAMRAFPDARPQVRLITEAYVAAHYGQVPDTQAQLARIRSAWERLQASVPS